MNQEPVPRVPPATAEPADGRECASLRQAIDFMLGFDYGEFAAWYRRGGGDSTAPTARSGVASMIPADGIVRDRTIALVGLMGAGKSCIGRRLAARLDLPFIDADREIEEAAGWTRAPARRFATGRSRSGCAPISSCCCAGWRDAATGRCCRSPISARS